MANIFSNPLTQGQSIFTPPTPTQTIELGRGPVKTTEDTQVQNEINSWKRYTQPITIKDIKKIPPKPVDQIFLAGKEVTNPVLRDVLAFNIGGVERVAALPKAYAEGSTRWYGSTVGWLGEKIPAYKQTPVYKQYEKGAFRGTPYEGEEEGAPIIKFQIPGTKETAPINVLGQRLTPQSIPDILGTAGVITGAYYAPVLAGKASTALLGPSTVTGAATLGGTAVKTIAGIGGMAAKGYLWPKIFSETGKIGATPAQLAIYREGGLKEIYGGGMRGSEEALKGTTTFKETFAKELSKKGYIDSDMKSITKYNELAQSYSDKSARLAQAMTQYDMDAKAYENTLKSVGTYNPNTRSYDITDQAAYTTLKNMGERLGIQQQQLSKESETLKKDYNTLLGIKPSDKPSITDMTSIAERQLSLGARWKKDLTPEQIAYAEKVIKTPEYTEAYKTASEAQKGAKAGWVRQLVSGFNVLGSDIEGFQKGAAKSAREYYSAQGLTGKELDTKVKAAVSTATRELGSLGAGQATALLDISRSSETLGQILAAKSFQRGALATVTPAKDVFWTTFRKTAIPLALAGFGEGGGIYVAEATAKKQKFDPLQYALYGGIGGLSAATLGGAIAGFGAKAAIGKPVAGRAGLYSKTLLGGAYVTDPGEWAGDKLSKLFREEAGRVIGKKPLEAAVIPVAGKGIRYAVTGGTKIPIRTTAAVLTPGLVSTPVDIFEDIKVPVTERAVEISGIKPVITPLPASLSISQPVTEPITSPITETTYTPVTTPEPVVTRTSVTTPTTTTTPVSTPVTIPVTVPSTWPFLGTLGGAGEAGGRGMRGVIAGVNVNYLRNFFFDKVKSETGRFNPSEDLRFKLKKSGRIDKRAEVIFSELGMPSRVTGGKNIKTDMLSKSRIASNSAPFSKKLSLMVKKRTRTGQMPGIINYEGGTNNPLRHFL